MGQADTPNWSDHKQMVCEVCWTERHSQSKKLSRATDTSSFSFYPSISQASPHSYNPPRHRPGLSPRPRLSIWCQRTSAVEPLEFIFLKDRSLFHLPDVHMSPSDHQKLSFSFFFTHMWKSSVTFQAVLVHTRGSICNFCCHFYVFWLWFQLLPCLLCTERSSLFNKIWAIWQIFTADLTPPTPRAGQG